MTPDEYEAKLGMNENDAIKDLRRMVEPVMEAAQKYGNTKQAFGQAYEGEREEAEQRYGKQLEPQWDAVKQAAMLVVAQARAEALPRISEDGRYVYMYVDCHGGHDVVGDLGDAWRDAQDVRDTRTAAEALVAQLEESMTSKRDVR